MRLPQPRPVIGVRARVRRGFVGCDKRWMTLREALNEHFIERVKHQDTGAWIANQQLLQSKATPLNVAPIAAQGATPWHRNADAHSVAEERIQHSLRARSARAHS